MELKQVAHSVDLIYFCLRYKTINALTGPQELMLSLTLSMKTFHLLDRTQKERENSSEWL